MNMNLSKTQSDRSERKRANTPYGIGSFAQNGFRLVAVLGFLLSASFSDAAELPFKGRIDGSFILTPTANPTIMSGEADAVGIATHTGAFTKVTSDVVNIVTGEVEGSFTMTTANGDLVMGVYSGFTVPKPDGTFSWVLNATLTGGTGRFVEATGDFVFVAEGTYVMVDGNIRGTYSETFEGTISY
jgi:hypothetical protein